MADPAFYINTAGSVVPVAPDEAAGASELGWIPASPQQIKDFQIEAKYGSPGQQAITAVEHAASALTFGASDVAERVGGLSTPEAMAGREQANPGAAMLGTAAGVALPLVSTLGGASAFTAPSLIARAGQAATRGAAALLPAGESALARMAVRAASAGAGSAIEGAAYGAGQVVHEAALGDPNLTAQSALATIGFSAALGAGIGGAGGVLAQGFREIGPSDIGAKLRSWAGEFEGERNIKAAGAIQSDIKRVVRQKGREGLQAIGREAGEMGLVGPLSTPESTLEKSQAVMEEAGQGMGALLKGADATAGEAAPKMREVLPRIESEVLAPMRKNPFQAPLADSLSQTLSGYGDQEGFQALHQIRRQVSDEIYGLRGNLDPEGTYKRAALRQVRGILSDELNTGLEKSGGLSGEWKTLNRRYEVGSTIADFADAGINRLHGNNLVSPTEFIAGVAQGPVASLMTAAARRHGSGALGAAARALRKALDVDGAAAVAGKTAELIAAERQAGTDTIAQEAVSDARAEAAKFAALNGTQPMSPQGVAAEAEAQTVAGRVDAEKLRRIEAGRTPGTGGSASVAQARAQADALRTAEMMGANQGLPLGAVPNESDRMAVALGMRSPPAPTHSAPETVAALSLLERMRQSVSNQIDSGVSGIVRAAPKAATVGRSEAAAGIASIFAKSHEDATAIYSKRISDLQKLAQNPQELHATLERQTDDWHEHAPNTAQAVQTASARAVSFLASKVPKHESSGPLAPKWAPTKSEVAKFNRYYEAVQRPTSILKAAAAGTLTPEALEAVKTVYPALFQQIQSQLMDKLAGKKDVPYRSRLMLSMLLGQNIDGSTNGMTIARNQMAMAPQPMPQPSPTRADKLSVADRAMTDTQRSAERGE